MKKIFLSILLVIFSFSFVSSQDLSEEATISLLTASPLPSQIVSSYGHTLLRVNDPKLNIDYVFNYGMFDQSLSGLQTVIGIFRGKLQYEIWVTPFVDYYESTKRENRTLIEHQFIFSSDEKRIIWRKLIGIAKNKEKYTFDFITQNCTTFARDLITYNLGKQIVLPPHLGTKTFNDINEKHVRNNLWSVFAIKIIAGISLDDIASPYESLYDPSELEEAWSKSIIQDSNGEKPLLSEAKILIGSTTSDEREKLNLVTPFVSGFVFFLAVLVLTILEWKKKRFYKWLDIFVFGIIGLVGIFFYVFKLSSVQQYINLDLDMLWIHPLHLIVVVFLLFNRKIKPLFIYHVFNIVLLTFLTVVFLFIYKENIIMFVFFVSLMIRSLSYILRNSTDNKIVLS